MSPQSSRPVSGLIPLSALAFALLATVASAGVARAAPPFASPIAASAPEDEAALLVARDRSARADASVDALKRALTPGHLTDPTPETDGAYGLDTLRGEVTDLQRKAAGYRATLGDRHPTLVGTEQVLADFRTHLQDATRQALATASREAAEARAVADELDRRLAARSKTPPVSNADATGSIPSLQASEAAPALQPRIGRPATHSAAPRRDEAGAAAAQAAGLDRPVAHRLSEPLIALAAGALALLLAVGAALRVLRAIRPRARRSAARVEPAMATAEAVPVPPAEPARAETPTRPERPAAAPRDVVPVLATLPLPRSNAAADVAALFAAEPDGALARAAAALHATLRDAFPSESHARLTVLVAGAEGLGDGDGDLAALALAFAAAAAGRRAVILETRPAGRLRRGLVPAGTVPILVEAGGAERTLYRVDAGALTVAVLPTDPGEAEVAVTAGTRPQTGRVRGLDAFDLVVLVGGNAAALAAAADVVVIAADAAASPDTIAEAARPCRDAGRVCGALVLARPAAALSSVTRLPTRRRSLPDPVQIAPARLGLRGSIEPSRRRAGR